jgi:hypothetical protein
MDIVKFATGMLTQAEMNILGSPNSTHLDKPATDLPSNLGQAARPMYYLIDTLANKQLHDAGVVRVTDMSEFIVLVINKMKTPLLLVDSGLDIWAGTQMGQPSDPSIPSSGAGPVGNQDNVVPAAEEGHVGFGAWLVRNSGGGYGTTFGLTFKADADFFSTGVSLGCQADYKTSGPNQIALSMTGDSSIPRDDAYYNRNGAGKMVSETYYNTQTGHHTHFDACLQNPDATRAYLVVMHASTTQPDGSA